MPLTNEQSASLRTILREPDFLDALNAACAEEAARCDRMAIEHLNSHKVEQAERYAAFAAAWKSAMSRFVTLSKVEEVSDELASGG